MTMQTFCCCLPVRFGVFVLSFITLLGGGLLGGATWWQFTRLGYQNMTDVQRASIIIAGVSWSLLAVFSLFGLIGAISRSRGMVKAYATILWIHLGISVGTSAFFIYTLFRPGADTDLINACIEASNGVQVDQVQINIDLSDLRQACETSLKIVKGVFTGALVVILLIQFYSCIIVNRYLTQLSDEQEFKPGAHARGGSFSSARGPSGYYPHQPLSQNFPDPYSNTAQPAAAYHGQYPPNQQYGYTDPHNAFGSKV